MVLASTQLWQFVAAGGGVILGGIFLLWLVFAPGPRRARSHRHAVHLLKLGKWEPALGIVRELQIKGKLSTHWQCRLRVAEAECHRLAGEQAVQAKQFENGLTHL